MIFNKLSEEALQSDYFRALYMKLSSIAADRIFGGAQDKERLNEKELSHLLRFGDILSNSSQSNARNIAYKIISLLSMDYSMHPAFKTVSTAVFSKLGNFPALNQLNYQIDLPFERLLEKSVKEIRQKVSGSENMYYTDSQYELLNKIKDSSYYSFAGPTSMGKSFIIKAAIREMLTKSTRGNFVIVVPTRALINQTSQDIKVDLADVLEPLGYKVMVNAIVSEITNTLEDNYIFVLTPERLLRFLSTEGNPDIHCLFIDEAHKLTAEKDTRSVTLYLSVEKTLRKFPSVKLYFASPNVSNPEIFLELFNKDISNAFKTKESPVAQNLFFVDLIGKRVTHYTDYDTYDLYPELVQDCQSGLEFIRRLGSNQANIVYCNSPTDTVANARSFCGYLNGTAVHFSDEHRNELRKAKDAIKELIHKDYYLIECLDYGVAYHFGSLPQLVRNSIEMLFKKGVIKHLFCTSTLLEGVNLPAKNVFILKNKKGKATISKIDFWNLAGRAGRLNHELSGNIFCVRDNPTDWKKIDILDAKDEIRLKTSVSVNMDKKLNQIESILRKKPLLKGTEAEKEVLKYIANIISIDTLELNSGYMSPLIEKLIHDNKFEIIELARKSMEGNQVPREIIITNPSIIAKHQDDVYKYIVTSNPNTVKFPDYVNYTNVLNILNIFHKLYHWEDSEPKLKFTESLTYYAQLANNWVNGFSLHSLIARSLEYKRDFRKDILYYRNGQRMIEPFDIKNHFHVNQEINTLIGDIEKVLRFTLEKYFNNYYQMLCQVLGTENAGENWANFLEYGTQNSVIVELQNIGFSRHVANYLHSNHSDTLIQKNGKFQGINKKTLLLSLNIGSIEFDEINSLLRLQNGIDPMSVF